MNTILAHIPAYVYAIFAALLAMGIAQSRPRSVALSRTVLLPLTMGGLSLFGVLGTFGAGAAVLVWAAGLAATAFVTARSLSTAGIAYDAATRRFALPGSWLPLALMMAIFALKFAVGMSLALQPALHQSHGFALAVSVSYGLFSGLFAGRALPLWKLAADARRDAAPALARIA